MLDAADIAQTITSEAASIGQFAPRPFEMRRKEPGEPAIVLLLKPNNTRGVSSSDSEIFIVHRAVVLSDNNIDCHVCLAVWGVAEPSVNL